MVHPIKRTQISIGCTFKYILCYGSSRSASSPSYSFFNLNTSYVMVHPSGSLNAILSVIFKYILCYGSSETGWY